MAGRHAPTIRERRLAVELRRLRGQAGLTGDQAAERLAWSPSKISRIETGRRTVKSADLQELLELYQVTGQRRDALINLGRTARQKGWWDAYADLPTEYATYISLEQEAAYIRAYNPEIFHGLLQTEEYARHVIRAALMMIAPPGEVERRVEVRMTRQELLTRDEPLRLWTVVSEAVLHRTIGGPEVMYRQCEHVTELAVLPNVTFQVLPSSAGAHPATAGSFAVLEFPERYDPDVGYVETMTSSLYVEREEEVHHYTLAFDQLRAMALGPEESIDLVAKMARRS